jgi:hypothetical protein
MNRLNGRNDYGKTIRSMQKKTLNTPDEVRTFDKGKVELATVGTVTFGRANFEPGWKWSESVKPIVKTEYCEAPHMYSITSLVG